MDQGFNLMPIAISLGQAVPVWAIVAWAVNSYLNKAKEAQDELNHRIATIESDVRKIQLALAGAGLDTLEKDIESLKEAKAQTTVQIDSLWRSLAEYRELKLAKARHDS